MIDKCQVEDKENITMIDTLNFSGLQFPNNIFNQLSIVKKTQTKSSKTQKNLSNSVRAGDWICLVCNNLNFSFRNECNRCQMQTKKQNYIQNLILITEKKNPILDFKTDRKALRDMTNVSFEEGQQAKVSHQRNSSDGNSPVNSSSPPGLSTRTNTIQHSHSKFKDFEFSPNYGFENAILLTPPRFNTHTNDYTGPNTGLADSANKLLLPYQSPKLLPSVSPILRKVLCYSEQSNEEYYGNKYLKYKGNVQKSDEKRDNKTVIKIDNHQSLDDTVTDNFNFDEINKCIEETILNERYLKQSNMTHIEKYVDFSGFSNMLMKENINPSFLGVEKNYTVLFAGINMNDDKNTSNSNNSTNGTNNVTDSPYLFQGQQQFPKKERKADWICQWCNNLNYSFRKACNRCQVGR